MLVGYCCCLPGPTQEEAFQSIDQSNEPARNTGRGVALVYLCDWMIMTLI